MEYKPTEFKCEMCDNHFTMKEAYHICDKKFCSIRHLQLWKRDNIKEEYQPKRNRLIKIER
jgi:hypothetical protein